MEGGKKAPWPDDDEKNEWFVPMVLKEPEMNIVYLKRKGE